MIAEKRKLSFFLLAVLMRMQALQHVENGQFEGLLQG